MMVRQPWESDWATACCAATAAGRPGPLISSLSAGSHGRVRLGRQQPVTAFQKLIENVALEVQNDRFTFEIDSENALVGCTA